MRDTTAIIERVRRTAANLQRLEVAVEGTQREVQPGHHFLARLSNSGINSWQPYLREPWIPIRQQGNSLVIERPAEYAYQPGQIVSLLGPLGRPIPLYPLARTLLLIAYDAAPASLLMLAETALARHISVTLILVGTARRYALEALPEQIEVQHGDDQGNWPEQRTAFQWADQIVAVAPPSHESTRYARLIEGVRKVRIEIPEDYLLGLFQPPLPCGVGACQACLVRVGSTESAACIDGPAYDLTRVTFA